MSVRKVRRGAFALAHAHRASGHRYVPDGREHRITRARRRAISLLAMALCIALGLTATASVAAAQVPGQRPDTSAVPRTTSADSAAAAAYTDSLADSVPHKAVRGLSARRDSLARRTARLGAVTVTATPVQPTEPVSAVRVTPDAIAQTPANSPYELLRETAGMESHEQGQGPGFASDLSIRGFSSDHSTDIALWIDGVPINEPVNGHAEGYNDFNLLFPEAVSGIDVIKGPTSALYGNFAFSGVVNVQTLEHLNGTQIALTGGTYGNGEGVVMTGFDNGGTRGVLGLRVTHDDGWRPHSESQIGQLHARYLHDVTHAVTLDLGIEGFITSYNSPGFLDTASYLAKNYGVVSNFGDGGFKRHAQERASLRVVLSPSLFWRSTVYATEGTWNFWLSTPPGLGGELEGSGIETREYDGRYGGGATSSITYSVPGVQVTAGAETRYDHAHYENWGEAVSGFREDSVPFALVHAQQLSGGLFVQSNFDVTQYLRLDLGARVDQLSSTSLQPISLAPDTIGPAAQSQFSKGIFSPKSGLLVRLLPWAGVYANVSRGFRQADGVILDPTTPFITLWDYEAGVKVDRGPLDVDASVFRMDLSNEQSFNGVTTISGGPSRRRGIDLTARAAVTPDVTLSTSFTVVDAKYTKYFDSDVGVDYSGQPVFNSSRFVGDGAVVIRPQHSIWRLRVGTNFQGKYTPFEEAIGLTRPAFALFYASAGVRIARGLSLDASVRNILDTQYRELESGYFITPGQTRTLYGTVHYDIF
jgi:outer membrane receptor protein involved in Fe transport